LDSRTIRLSMIASSDREKTRRSPSRQADWPFDPRTLIDDLWMTGVRYLPHVSEYDAVASNLSSLIGRSHDIFRMPLTISYWLQNDHSVGGLFGRISAIADAHQSKKDEMGVYDALNLTLMALNQLVGNEDQISISTKRILETINSLAARSDVDTSSIPSTTQRVGILLSQLGFPKDPSHGGARSWRISRKQLDERAKGRGIILPKVEKEDQDVSTPDWEGPPIE
jgi:hypothetical protein